MSTLAYEYMCPNCVTPWKCNGPHIPEEIIPDSTNGTNELLDRLRKEEKELWRDRYDKQREMEKNKRWVYCPWCGSRLAIVPEGHICGYSDID